MSYDIDYIDGYNFTESMMSRTVILSAMMRSHELWTLMHKMFLFFKQRGMPCYEWTLNYMLVLTWMLLLTIAMHWHDLFVNQSDRFFILNAFRISTWQTCHLYTHQISWVSFVWFKIYSISFSPTPNRISILGHKAIIWTIS